MKEDSRSNIGILASRHLRGKKNDDVLLKILPGILRLFYVSADCLLLFWGLKQRFFEFMGAHNIISTLPVTEGKTLANAIPPESNESLCTTY